MRHFAIHNTIETTSILGKRTRCCGQAITVPDPPECDGGA
jgi:hypothetical protein